MYNFQKTTAIGGCRGGDVLQAMMGAGLGPGPRAGGEPGPWAGPGSGPERVRAIQVMSARVAHGPVSHA